MLATTLHAMAILLRTCKWDWFINLSASDYPLVTQDGMVSENGCVILGFDDDDFFFFFFGEFLFCVVDLFGGNLV